MQAAKRNWTAIVAIVVATVAIAAGAHAFSGDDDKKAKSAGSAATKADVAAKKAEHAKRVAMFKKEFTASKVSLGSVIACAETATKGRAHAADVELGRDGKLHFVVGLLVADKFVEVEIDPASGKVLDQEDDDEEDGIEDDDDDDNGNDDDGDDGDDDDAPND
jgi:uncharacterized membrane protein YkoI